MAQNHGDPTQGNGSCGAMESRTDQAVRPDAVFGLLGLNFNLALNALEGGGFPRPGLGVRNGTITSCKDPSPSLPPKCLTMPMPH